MAAEEWWLYAMCPKCQIEIPVMPILGGAEIVGDGTAQWPVTCPHCNTSFHQSPSTMPRRKGRPGGSIQ